MKKKHSSFQLLILLVVGCISLTSANAASVSIQGLTPIGIDSATPIYLVENTSITVSSSAGSFDYIYIDGNRIDYNSSSYWSSYTLNISAYHDGQLHNLQLKRGDSDYGSCIFGISAAIAKYAKVDGIQYVLIDGIATVVGSMSAEIEEANILSTITTDGVDYPVTSISSNAFANLSKLRSVTIPETITSIGNSAFSGCTALTSIEIPESVTTIGNTAFSGCTSLSSLTFNAINCTSCGSSDYPAFPSTIAYLTFDNGVTKIPSYFLYNGSQIECVTLPKALISIGESAFRNSTALTLIEIPESVTTIGNSAFSGCTSLSSLTFNAINCTSCGSLNYPAFPSTITYLTFGNGVTKIPSYFLYKGSMIENVSLPSALTSIGAYAFRNNSKLKSIVVPATVNSIGSNVFYGCSALVKSAYPSSISNPFDYGISISYPSTGMIDDSGVIYNSDKTTVYFAPLSLEGTYTIPTTVAAIGESAFRNSTALTSIEIPEVVTTIGNSAFSGCTALTSIEIPESVTTIGNSAFSGCTSLKSIVVPATVNSIGSNAFYGCSALVKSAYPSSISNPFDYGISISYPSTGMIDDSGVIYNSDKTTVYFAPLSLEGTYTIPNTVTAIGESAFRNSTALTSIEIPESVTTIGNSAFSGCTSLSSLTFNAINCTSCGSSNYPAFPSTITYLTFGNGVTKIPSYFLYNGSQIECVIIPNAVTTIGDYAFHNSTNLKSLTLGSGLLSIGRQAFSCTISKVFWLGNTPPTGDGGVTASVNYVANDQYRLSNQVKYQFLSSKFIVDGTYYVPVSPSERTCDVIDCDYSLSDGNVVISDKVDNQGVELSVLNINDYSYYNNQAITSLILGNKGNVGNNVFYNCDALTTVTVNNNGSIGSSAFSNCDTLTTVTVNNNGSIGSSAFSNCGALNNVVLGDFITTIGDKAFYSCSALPTITLPNNVTAIGEYIFYGCSKLATINIGTGISSIPRYSFAGCSVLNNLSIPNNVKSIGDYVFSGCLTLANLTLEDNEQEEEITETPSMQTFDDWTSTNHSGGTTSNKEYTISVMVGDRLSFDYTVDSESGYDYLIIKINGIEVVKESGNKSDNYTKTFSESGSVTLSLFYTKDSSQSSGQDKASVYNITLNGKGREIDNLQLGSNGSTPLFYDCPLEVVYIGRKLSYETGENYGYSPFYRNTSLRSVEISDAETQICDNEFYGCTNLKTLKIGNGVKTIGKWAFSGCSSLDYFSAGYHVESIGEEAFSDCTGLTKYYSFSAIPPVCGNQALDDINKWECTLFVPSESSDEYMSAEQWNDFFFINENEAVLAEDIRINVESVNGELGSTFQLAAEVLPENATRKIIEWSSSDDAVATVNATGLITFVNEGNATITAHATDGSGVESSVAVTVINDNSGVDAVTIEDVNITVINNQVVISKLTTGTIAQLYGLNGVLLNSTIGRGEDVIFDICSNSYYILTIGRFSVKLYSK